MLRERGLPADRLDALLRNNADQSELSRRIARNGGATMQNADVVTALQQEQRNVANTMQHHQQFYKPAVQEVKITVEREQPGWLGRWYIKWPLILGAVGLAGYFGWGYLKELLEGWNKDVAERAAKGREMIDQPNFKAAEAQKIDKDYTAKITTGGAGGGAADTQSLNKSILGDEGLKKVQDATKQSLDKGTFEFPRGPR